MASGLTLPRLRFVDVAGDVLFPEQIKKVFEKVEFVGPIVSDQLLMTNAPIRSADLSQTVL